MCACTLFVRLTTKWILFHILTQTMIVNSWVLYQKVIGKLNMFKRQIFLKLLKGNQQTTVSKKTQIRKN